MEINELRKLKLSQVMTLSQLRAITGTSVVNVTTNYRPMLTIVKPFPADHVRPDGRRNMELIVCDWRLRRLLKNLRENGRCKALGIDPLEIAKKNFDFIR